MISERALPDAAEQFYKAADSIPPTFTRSVFNSFKEGFYTGFEALNVLQPKADENLQSIWDTIQETNRKSDEMLTFGQKATRFVPNLISNGLGMAFNPITYPFAVAGGLTGKGITTLAEKVAPESVSLFARKSIPQLMGTTLGKYLPKSLAELGKVTTHGFTSFAGVAVPGAIISNFNRDTRSLNWGGFTEEVGFNGAIGALLSIPGYAAGTLFKNILHSDESLPMPGTENTEWMLQRIEDAFKAGKLTKDEYEWGKDFYTDPHKTDLNDRAAKILLNKGHTIDAAKSKVFFEMLSEEDWKNLSSIFAEQYNAADYMRDKSALSDFILGGRLDKLRENPDIINGLIGYLAEADHKLSNKEAKLKEADAILDKYLFAGMTEKKFPFDQHDIFDMVYNDRFFQEDNPNLPVTIPDEVEKAVKSAKTHEYAEYKLKLIAGYIYKKIADAEEAMNKDFYHGSNALEDINKFDIEKSSKNSLYGAGLYLTDRKDIAMGYGLTAGGVSKYKTNLPGKIFKLRFRSKPKLIDIEKRPSKEVFKIIKEEAIKHGYHIEDSQIKRTINKIYKKMRDDLSPENVNREYFAEIGDLLTGINNALQKKGYDGFNHVGGQILGRGKKLHNVIVIFGKKKVENGVKHIKNPVRLLKQEKVDIAAEFKEQLDKIKLEKETPKYSDHLLDARQELTSIYDKLLKDGLPDNYKFTKEYNRLVELADVWRNAQTLLDRVELEASYARQEAYRNLAKGYVDAFQSHVDKFADSDRVMNYLRQRIDHASGITEKLVEMAKEEIPSPEFEGTQEEQFQKFDEQIKFSDSETLNNEYNEAKKRFNQFKDAGKALQEMVDCIGRKG